MIDEIYAYIKSNGPVPAWKISDATGIDVLDVENGVEILQSQGYPVIEDRNGDYTLARTFGEAREYRDAVLIPQAEMILRRIIGVTNIQEDEVEGYRCNSLAQECRTLPVAGTMRNGSCYRLAPLVPRTCGRGCGLWPTLLKGDGHSRLTSQKAIRLYSAGESLTQHIRDLEGRDTGALNPRWAEWWMGFPEGWGDTWKP
jgi:hypothetical protein